MPASGYLSVNSGTSSVFSAFSPPCMVMLIPLSDTRSTGYPGKPEMLEVTAACSVMLPTEDGIEPSVGDLVNAAQHPRVLAIGETGLDYYRLKEPLDWQRERFRVHIRAAREAGKPLVVHSRSAPADTLRLLREERAADVGGVMHCFTESLDFALAALDLGFYISFSGIVTFRNASALQQVVPHVPHDRLLIETDAPYLAPVPHRGRVNEPAHVVEVAAQLARLTAVSTPDMARMTRDNFATLFGVSIG